MTKTKKTLGKSEAQILRYILEKESVSVGEAAKHFLECQGLARTTVLTVMERLRKKGFLTRKEKNGIYEYSSKLSKESWLKQQIRDFVDTALGGTVSPLIHFLVESKISEDELTKLEDMIQDLSDREKE